MEKLSKSSRQATKELESYFNMQKKKNLEIDDDLVKFYENIIKKQNRDMLWKVDEWETEWLDNDWTPEQLLEFVQNTIAENHFQQQRTIETTLLGSIVSAFNVRGEQGAREILVEWKDNPVAQNAKREALPLKLSSSWASPIAVDSSIVQ